VAYVRFCARFLCAGVGVRELCAMCAILGVRVVRELCVTRDDNFNGSWSTCFNGDLAI
jgi:hypothetical protein